MIFAVNGLLLCGKILQAITQIISIFTKAYLAAPLHRFAVSINHSTTTGNDLLLPICPYLPAIPYGRASINNVWAPLQHCRMPMNSCRASIHYRRAPRSHSRMSISNVVMPMSCCRASLHPISAAGSMQWTSKNAFKPP
jgi:hypothetical protein